MLATVAKAALIVVTVFVVAVIVLAAWQVSHPSADKQQQQNVSQERQPDKKDTKNKDEGVFANFLAGIGSFVRLLDRHNGLVNAIGTLIVAIFTGVLFLATVALFYSSEKVADAAKQSANVAEKTLVATQRPWVSVEMKIISPLTYDAEGNAQITIGFMLKNIGNSPAVELDLIAELHPIFGDAVAKKQKLCDAVRKSHPLDSRVSEWGLVLFPQQSMPFGQALSVSHKEIEEFNLAQAGDSPIWPKDRLIWPAKIIGCVNYKFTFTDGYHQTGFVGLLHRPSPDGPNYPPVMFRAGEDVPIEAMELIPSRFGSSAD